MDALTTSVIFGFSRVFVFEKNKEEVLTSLRKFFNTFYSTELLPLTTETKKDSSELMVYELDQTPGSFLPKRVVIKMSDLDPKMLLFLSKDLVTTVNCFNICLGEYYVHYSKCENGEEKVVYTNRNGHIVDNINANRSESDGSSWVFSAELQRVYLDLDLMLEEEPRKANKIEAFGINSVDLPTNCLRSNAMNSSKSPALNWYQLTDLLIKNKMGWYKEKV